MEQRDVFCGLTVGEAVHPKNYGTHVRPDDSLGDVADALAASGRTAVGVSDEDDVWGMVTVNDIMRAYFEGLPATKRLSTWLQSGGARAPEPLLRQMEVRPTALLSEVAEKMVQNAIRGDCACHHILVKELDGRLSGVVSSHDLVAAFHRQDVVRHLVQGRQATEENRDAEEAMANTKVRDVMKPRNQVFACEPTDTLRMALKTLLVSQQNFVLVVDPTGIFGFITSRDIVKAFADAEELDTTVADFLKTLPAERSHRTILSNAKVIDAAEELCRDGVDHLVVINPGECEAVGVLSSLDVILHTKWKELVLDRPSWSGPTLEEVLKSHTAPATTCTSDTTVAAACRRLLAAGQTSALLGDSGGVYGLITENDFVRAFVKGFGDCSVGEFLEDSGDNVVPQYLQATPWTHLTDAGAMMLRTVQLGRGCHHLVVRDVSGVWIGVVSALDVARALRQLPSKLEAARLGVDVVPVQAVMKPAEDVPTCSTEDLLKDVLDRFEAFEQNAVMVKGEASSIIGLITPRCAMQALAAGTSPTTTVGDWMRTRQMQTGPREVQQSISIMDAAATMAKFNLHHLVVVDVIGGEPVGVLSALDVVRGVVSVHHQCPFLSLAWLRRLNVPTSFSPQDFAVRQEKRLAGEAADGESPSKTVRRAEELGA